MCPLIPELLWNASGSTGMVEQTFDLIPLLWTGVMLTVVIQATNTGDFLYI